MLAMTVMSVVKVVVVMAAFVMVLKVVMMLMKTGDHCFSVKVISFCHSIGDFYSGGGDIGEAGGGVVGGSECASLIRDSKPVSASPSVS